MYAVNSVSRAMPLLAVNRSHRVGPAAGTSAALPVQPVPKVAPAQRHPGEPAPNAGSGAGQNAASGVSKPFHMQNMQSLLNIRPRTEVDPDYIRRAMERLGNFKSASRIRGG